MTKKEALHVTNLVIHRLSQPNRWTKEGDFEEECMEDQDSYTLSCALKLAQKEVLGTYRSRNLVMRRVRGKIRRHFIWRHGIHPIYSFNKHRKTTHSDLMFLLIKVRKSFEE